MIIIAGAAGYIGGKLYEIAEKAGMEVFPLFRNSPIPKNEADYFINAAMPSRRFWAEQNPVDDFKETVQKTADFFYKAKFKKFIQISSLSARLEPSVYGRHKKCAETMIDPLKHLIFRLTMTYDNRLKKGVLYDLLNGNPVYAKPESQYSLSSLERVCEFILSNLDKVGAIEVGGKTPISLKEIAYKFRIEPVWEGDNFDMQIINSTYGAIDDLEQTLNEMRHI